MKTLGISAAILTGLSFLLWLSNWIYWTFLYTTASYDVNNPIRYVMQGVSVFSTLTEYLAILLISIGLFLAAGRISKN